MLGQEEQTATRPPSHQALGHRLPADAGRERCHSLWVSRYRRHTPLPLPRAGGFVTEKKRCLFSAHRPRGEEGMASLSNQADGGRVKETNQHRRTQPASPKGGEFPLRGISGMSVWVWSTEILTAARGRLHDGITGQKTDETGTLLGPGPACLLLLRVLASPPKLEGWSLLLLTYQSLGSGGATVLGPCLALQLLWLLPRPQTLGTPSSVPLWGPESAW